MFRETKQTGDNQDWAKHQEDFVPTALVCEKSDHTTSMINSRATGVIASPPSVLICGNPKVKAGSMVVVMRTQVEETIEVIRPALQADGGDIILRDVNEETGVVSVSLTGACVSCPASTQTLKAGIERIMRDRIDGVTEVVNIDDDALDALLDTGANAR